MTLVSVRETHEGDDSRQADPLSSAICLLLIGKHSSNVVPESCTAGLHLRTGGAAS